MFPSSVCVVLMTCSNLVEWEGPVGMNGCVPSKNDAVVASLGDDLERTTARIEIIDHRKDAQFVSSRLGNQRLYPLAHCLPLMSCTGRGIGPAFSPRSIVKTICWIEVKR